MPIGKMIKYEITFEKRESADEFLKLMEPVSMYSLNEVEPVDVLIDDDGIVQKIINNK
jgi:hypothetical protein